MMTFITSIRIVFHDVSCHTAELFLTLNRYNNYPTRAFFFCALL